MLPGPRTPTTPGATPGQGQEPGASGSGPQSQGPNDPLNPPANGGTTGTETGREGGERQTAEERREQNQAEMTARLVRERDEARAALTEEQRKSLPASEVERLKALDQQLIQQKVREKQLILKYEIASRAPRLGIVDPELAVLLLEKNGSVSVDDAGNVTGLDEALKALIKERPHLVKRQPDVDAGAGTTGPRTGRKPGMNEIIRGAARGRPVEVQE